VLFFLALRCLVWITEMTLIHKNIRSVRSSHAQVYQSVRRKTLYDVTDKNNNVSSEDLDRHYHKYPSVVLFFLALRCLVTKYKPK
jgi:hypothetical protein